MAIVPYLDLSEIDERHHHLLERPIHLFRALVNAPEGFTRFQAFAEWIRWDAAFDPRLRELAILAVGYLAGDAYEWSHHVRLAPQFGVTDSDIRGLIDLVEGRPTALDETAVLVLTVTAQLFRTRSIDDELTARLASTFSDRDLTEFIMIVAFYAMVVTLLGGLRIDVEPDYLPDLERFPFGERTSTRHDSETTR